MYAIRSYYAHKVDKSYYYLLLDPGLKADEENLLRITQNINRSYDCNIDATPCELTLFNRIQLGLRLYNPEERTIPKIVVITSYSIHYTKLYDSPETGQMQDNIFNAVAHIFSVVGWKPVSC